MLNLSRREADVAIRLARPDQGDLSIRKIGTMGFGLYASPDYVAAHGAPASAGELRDHRVIDWLDGFPENAVVLWLRRQLGDNIPVFSTNPASARLAAARPGDRLPLGPCIGAIGREAGWGKELKM